MLRISYERRDVPTNDEPCLFALDTAIQIVAVQKLTRFSQLFSIIICYRLYPNLFIVLHNIDLETLFCVASLLFAVSSIVLKLLFSQRSLRKIQLACMLKMFSPF